MATSHAADHHHDHRTSALRITCLTICVAIPFFACATLSWLSARSNIPATRPAKFAVKYQDYIPPGSPAGGPVQVKQSFEVSSERCYRNKPPESGSCTVTEAELDMLYRVLRANQFDIINNLWFRLVRPPCGGDGITLITVTINETKYIKDQPTGCTSDPRWRTVVGTLRTFIEQKQLK